MRRHEDYMMSINAEDGEISPHFNTFVELLALPPPISSLPVAELVTRIFGTSTSAAWADHFRQLLSARIRSATRHADVCLPAYSLPMSSPPYHVPPDDFAEIALIGLHT